MDFLQIAINYIATSILQLIDIATSLLQLIDYYYAPTSQASQTAGQTSLIWLITGGELLALNIDGLKMMGIGRAGTLCLLLKEIEKLEKASQDFASSIEHSPYCYGKILDHLRLRRFHLLGLLAEEPLLPKVYDSQKERFEKMWSIISQMMRQSLSCRTPRPYTWTTRYHKCQSR
jgi:hypothetical protein